MTKLTSVDEQMSMKEFVAKEKSDMIDTYRKKYHRIVQDYTREKEIEQSYHGRELLELIQNADDEIIDEMSTEVQITFNDNELTVSNCGKPFSKEGVISLMYSNVSPKRENHKVIGNKGTGFRSILGWANRITIHSGDLHIAFSEEYAQSVIVPNIYKRLENKDKVATLVFPEWIEETHNSKFTTDISITVKNITRITADIKRQLDAIDGSLLLFLNHITALHVINDDKNVIYRKTEKQGKVYITKEIGNEIIDTEIWRFNSALGSHNGESYQVVMAYHDDGSVPNRQVVYSYFPTDVDFPFPVLMHANFNIDANRNHLIKNDPANEAILRTAANLLAETALKLAQRKKKKVNYDALKLIISTDGLGKDLRDYNFENTLIESIKSIKILPTVNNRYISINDKPVFFNYEMMNYVNGEGFDSFLKFTTDSSVISFCNDTDRGYTIYKRYRGKSISEKLNRWLKGQQLSVDTAYIDSIIMRDISTAYTERVIKSDGSSPKLNIVFDTNGRRINHSNSAFLQDEKSGSTELPEFARISFIHPIMQEQLRKIVSSDTESLVNTLQLFNVRRFDTVEIINRMNDVVKKAKRNNGSNKAKEVVHEIVRWLWENRQIVNKTSGHIPIYMVNRLGKIQFSNELYYGREYGNSVCDNLFSGNNDKLFVEDISALINCRDMSELRLFLEKHDVAKYPRRNITDVSTYETADYIAFCRAHLKYPLKALETYYNRTETIEKKDAWSVRIRGTVTGINCLDYILNNSATTDIINWIREDDVLYDILSGKPDPSANYEIIWGLKQDYRKLKEKMISYLSWCFRHYKWIEVDNKRYSLEECVLESIGNKLAPVIVQPDIDTYIQNEKGNKNTLKTACENLLESIGAYRNFTNMPSEKIYSVLSSLPDKDPDGDIAKTIYRKLATSDTKCDESKERKAFLEGGKVFTQKGEYQQVSETYYLDRRGVSNYISAKYNLIDLPTRKSFTKVFDWFGVKRLALEVELAKDPVKHYLDREFQEDLKGFKVSAFAYRINQNPSKPEGKMLTDLRIIICDSIYVKYNDEYFYLSDYDYICRVENKEYYLKIPSSIATIEELKNSLDVAIAVSDMFCEVLNLDMTEKFMNIYSRTQDDRRKIISKTLDDEQIYDESRNILSSFTSEEDEFKGVIRTLANGSLTPSVLDALNKINFYDINCIDNAPYIIEIFRTIGIDIDDYNENSFTTVLSLKHYYQSMLSGCKTKYNDLYKTCVYERLKHSPIDKQEQLVNLFYELNIIRVDITDSVSFNFEKAFFKATLIKPETKVINLGALLENNKATLINKLKYHDNVDEFLMNNENLSLLYFGQYDELKYRYENLYNEEEEHHAKETANPNPHKRLVSIRKAITIPTKKKQEKPAPQMSTGYAGASARTLKKREDIGFAGEYAAYEFLKSNYQSVVWVSENAKKAGINPEGSAGYGYDISYIDDNGKNIYVEVKSSSSDDIAFYMSSGEYSFAKEHFDSYQIIFVKDALRAPNAVILEGIIAEGGFDTTKCSVSITSEYTITAMLDSEDSRIT